MSVEEEAFKMTAKSLKLFAKLFGLLGFILIKIGGLWLILGSICCIVGYDYLLETNPILAGVIIIIGIVFIFLGFPIALINKIVSKIKKEKVNILALLFCKITGKSHGVDTKGFEAKLKTVNAQNITGMFFGKIGSKYFCKNERLEGNALVIGGQGSGKTSTVAINTLMSWKKTVLAIDIKGELYQKSKKARGENVIIFNPQKPKTSKGYNPYYLLENAEDITQEAMMIAEALIPVPANVKEPMWIENAQFFLSGCIIYYFNLGMNFVQTMEQIKLKSARETVDLIMKSEDTFAKMQMSTFKDMSDGTLGGVFAEVNRAVTIFATNQALRECLSKDDYFVPDDLESNDIFIQIEESMLETYKMMLALLLNQFGKFFERRPDGEGEPILFLIDEFPRIGKTKVPQFLSTLRSKKIQFMLFAQSKEGQLDTIYGKETKTIEENCQYKICLKATEPSTQKWFSDMIGTADRKRKGTSYNASNLSMHSSSGTSSNYEEKRIIKPEELAYLPNKNEAIIITPQGFKRIKKAPYYKDKAFKKYL